MRKIMGCCGVAFAGLGPMAGAAASGPAVFDITFFNRTSSATAFAGACDDGDFPGTSSLQSSDFSLPGGGLIVSAEAGRGACAGRASAVEWVQTTSPAEGSAMTAIIQTRAGCIPDTVCPISISASSSDGPVDGASAGINCSTSWSMRIDLNEEADVTFRLDYDLDVTVSGGPFSAANATASVSMSVSDGSLQQMFVVANDVGVSGVGTDSVSDFGEMTFPALPPGPYFVSFGQLDQAGTTLSDPDMNGDCDTTIGTTMRITAVATSPACAADLTCDGMVGVTDLVAILANWGPCPGCAQDLDASGDVGVSDIILLLAAWGPC